MPMGLLLSCSKADIRKKSVEKRQIDLESADVSVLSFEALASLL
jgi:hypothetical protein